PWGTRRAVRSETRSLGRPFRRPDPGQRALIVLGYPHRAAACGDAARLPSDVDGLAHDAARTGVDPRDRVAGAVGDPDAPNAIRDAPGRVADVDRPADDATAPGGYARDAVIVVVGHPDHPPC